MLNAANIERIEEKKENLFCFLGSHSWLPSALPWFPSMGGGGEAPILKGGLLVVPVKAIKTGVVTSYGVRVLSRKEYDKRQ